MRRENGEIALRQLEKKINARMKRRIGKRLEEVESAREDEEEKGHAQISSFGMRREEGEIVWQVEGGDLA